MVKQINWSPLAKEEFRNLLLSSLQKHGNKEQGKVIYSLFQNALHRITLNPFIGQATEADNIRYITAHPDYTLFYRHSLLKIEVPCGEEFPLLYARRRDSSLRSE